MTRRVAVLAVVIGLVWVVGGVVVGAVTGEWRWAVPVVFGLSLVLLPVVRRRRDPAA